MRPFLHRLRAPLLIALASVVLLEIALRAVAMMPVDTAIFVADPVAGFRTRPGHVINGAPTSSRGFNDVEHGARAPASTRRIAFLGDSFVFGVVPRGRSLTAHFKRFLKPEDGDVEVLNLGVPAAGPETYVGLLGKDASELGTDLAVVVFFAGNDLSQSHPDFETRLFFGGPRAVLSSPWRVAPSLDYVYAWRLLRGGARLLRHRSQGGDGMPGREEFLDIERRRLWVMAPPDASSRLAACHRGAAQHFASLREVAMANGMELAVILAPDRVQVDAALRQALGQRGVDFSSYDLEQPQATLRARLEELAIPHLDLLDAFRNHPSGEKLHIDDNTHWNGRGNRLAALEIAQFLRRERLLKAISPPPPPDDT